MILAKVVGSVVSTIKDPGLHGSKLLIVRRSSPTEELHGEPFVAVDTVSAGEGELVLVACGSAARVTAQTQDAPVDAVIMAIIDQWEVGGETRYRKVTGEYAS